MRENFGVFCEMFLFCKQKTSLVTSRGEHGQVYISAGAERNLSYLVYFSIRTTFTNSTTRAATNA